MPETTLTERVLSAVDNRVSYDAVKSLVEAAQYNILVNEHLEQIAGHNEFPEQYESILDAMRTAVQQPFRQYMTSDVLDTVLRPDVSAGLMKQSIAAAASGVSVDTLNFAFDSVELNQDVGGYSLSDAVETASDIIACRTNGIDNNMIPDSWFCNSESADRYGSPLALNQIEAFTQLSHNMDRLSKQLAAKANNNPHIREAHSADYLRSRLLSELDGIGCFDKNNTPAQIEAFSNVFVHYFNEYPNWNGELPVAATDDLLTVKDAIVSHDSFSDVYNYMIKKIFPDFSINKNVTADSMWTDAKRAVVSDEIMDSEEAVNDKNPLPGLRRICINVGLSEAEADDFTEKAALIAEPTDFFDLSSGINSDIRFVADMLIEGIPAEDVFDYVNVLNNYDQSLESLYECFHAGLPKEVTMQCVDSDLNSIYRAEIITGQQNGLSEEQLLSMIDKGSFIEACQARLVFQEENGISISEEMETASVMEDSADKANLTVKEQIEANKNIIAHDKPKVQNGHKRNEAAHSM